jgi:SAM-dependent methyltransferase
MSFPKNLISYGEAAVCGVSGLGFQRVDHRLAFPWKHAMTLGGECACYKSFPPRKLSHIDRETRRQDHIMGWEDVMPLQDVTFKDIERSGWNRLAEHYDHFAGSFTSQCVDSILDLAEVGIGTRVLDVACGTGMLAAGANQRGADATGIDFAEEMVTTARRRHPSLTFERGDAEALQYAGGSFDAVVCGFGMLHFADPERAIAEAARVLRPGGRYVFSVWCPPQKAKFFELVMDAIKRWGDPEVATPPAPPMFKFADPATASASLTAAGLQHATTREVTLMWLPSSADEVVAYCYKSSVRLPLLLDPQTESARTKIFDSIRSGAERFRTASGYEVPWPALLCSAERP